MSAIDLLTIGFIAIAAVLSFRNWRGILWLTVILLDYAIATAWWRSGLANPELVTGLCDAALCLSIFFVGRHVWEMRVWAVYMVSIATNFIYLASNLSGLLFLDHEVYSIIEEVLNAAAIIIIGLASRDVIAGRTDGRAFDPWTYNARSVLPFWRKG
jgi:hypothetical protein